MSQRKFVLENATLFCQLDPVPEGAMQASKHNKLLRFYGTFSAQITNISTEAQTFRPEPEFYNVIEPPEGHDEGYTAVKVLKVEKPVEENLMTLQKKGLVRRDGIKRIVEVEPVRILPGRTAEVKFEWQTFKRYADMEPFIASTPIRGGMKITVQCSVPEIEFTADYAHRNAPSESSQGDRREYELEGVVLANQGMTLYWFPKEGKQKEE